MTLKGEPGSRGSRVFFIAGLLLAAAAGGGCACGGYQVSIVPGDDLRNLTALPVAIYFAPEEEVSRCEDPALTASRWFDSGEKHLTLDRNQYVALKITAGESHRQRYPHTGSFQKKAARIFIWVDYPIGTEAAQKKSRTAVDPKKVQKCSLDILLTLQGIVVRSGGQPIAGS
jgi:hypothetical protein